VPRKEKSSSATSLQNRDLVALSLDRIAAILMRAGLDSPHAEKLLRRAFIVTAQRAASSARRKATQSQIATMAGVSRLEVRRTLEESGTGAEQVSAPRNTRVDQLIRAWRTDKRFTTKHGRPRPLNSEGGTQTFDELVRIYGRDVTKRTLRDQLIKQGLVVEKNGKLHLNEAACVTRNSSIETADLRFIASQLSAIDFAIGKRAYVTKRIALSAEGKKALMAMRQIASTRLETVLNSLESMSTSSSSSRTRKRPPSHRLLVTASIATESEEEK
jgi:hypothetical protein